MSKRLALVATAWTASCGAAFYLGHSTSDDSSTEISNLQENQNTTNRVSIRTGGSESNISERRSDSRSASTSRTQTDFTQQVTDLAKMSDPIARAQGMLDLVENLSAEEFEGVIAAFRGLGMTRERMGEYGILLTAWAKVDPLGALDYAKENTGTSFARQTILASWAQTQPEAAIAWAQGNFEPDGDNQANPWLVGIIKGIASQDLTRASQLLEELPLSRGRGEALTAVLDGLLQQGPTEAKNWINNLSDDRLREGAAARLAVTLAEEDPRAALDWASAVSEESLTRASGQIVGDWAKDDPQGAQAWVEGQPEQVQAAAGRGLMNTIARENPLEASAWLSQHEGNPAFDGAVQSFVFNTIQSEPEMGADWIMKVTDSGQSERLFHRVLGTWMRDDSESLSNYLQNNDVHESIVRRAERQFEEQDR